MGAFLYFNPQVDKPVTREDVGGWGLAYAFDGSPQHALISGRTPTGEPGQLFADNSRIGEQRFGYKEDNQTWRKIPKSDVWVGFDNLDRPSPDALLRRESLDGEGVKLNDGLVWIIPRLWFFADGNGFQLALPIVADVDDEGNWISGGVDVGHQELKDYADRMLEATIMAVTDEEHQIEPMDTVEMLDIAACLLSANYVISKTEIGMLGLLRNDSLLLEIGRAALDIDRAEEWALKKKPESLSLEPTVAAS